MTMEYPRFTLKELRKTLQSMDLTIRPMTEAEIREYNELSEAICEVLRPYRQRATRQGLADE